MTRVMLRVTATAAALLLGLGVVAGCGDDSPTARQPAATEAAENTTSASDSAAAAPQSAEGVPATTGGATASAAVAETRGEILQLEGALLDGRQFDLAATAGNDVLLWFWAPW